MKAGVDFGTSNVKAVWMGRGEQVFLSTADTSLDFIVQQMKADGVRKICAAGISYSAYAQSFRGFEVQVKKDNPIENEVMLQAQGTSMLLERDGKRISEFFLISIGTGTSYAIVIG